MQTRISFTKQLRLMAAVVSVVALSACSSTNHDDTNTQVTNDMSGIDAMCQANAFDHEAHARKSKQISQYLAAAKSLHRCVKKGDGEFANPEPAMQLLALASFNYLKAGEVELATAAVDEFMTLFPEQDLYFDDYSSFLDSIQALLTQQQLTSSQLARLNINANLKAELKRKQYWLTN